MSALKMTTAAPLSRLLPFVTATAMLLFATAESVTGLLVARIIQGVTTGAALGAGGRGRGGA